MAGEDPNATPGGEFNQDDIDALMAGDAAGGGDAEPAADADASGGELSQADIDAALVGGDVEPVSADAAASGSAGDGFSQDDIDALLAGEGQAGTPSPAEAPDSANEAVATQVADQRLDTAGRPFDEAAAAMAAAIEEEKAAAAAGGGSAETAGGPQGTPLDKPDFTGQGDEGKPQHGIDLLHDVGLRVKIELGRTGMLVENVLKLGEGSVVELDKLAGDPVDVFANDRLIARGEVLVLNDNFCVRISEIVTGTGRMAARG